MEWLKQCCNNFWFSFPYVKKNQSCNNTILTNAEFLFVFPTFFTPSSCVKPWRFRKQTDLKISKIARTPGPKTTQLILTKMQNQRNVIDKKTGQCPAKNKRQLYFYNYSTITRRELLAWTLIKDHSHYGRAVQKCQMLVKYWAFQVSHKNTRRTRNVYCFYPTCSIVSYMYENGFCSRIESPCCSYKKICFELSNWNCTICIPCSK